MKTLIVIPARWKSTRFPGKPLHLIAGVSMLARTAEIARRAGEESGARVVIATDDQRIVDHAETIGVASIMTDPDLPSGTDRARAAMQRRFEPRAVRYRQPCRSNGREPSR